MAAVRHFEFAKLWYFVKQPTLEAQPASAHKISLKSDDFQLRYSDKTFQNGGRPPS